MAKQWWIGDIGVTTPFKLYVVCAPSLSLSIFPLKMLSALVALFLIASVGAETNVTIDDMDPRVVYQPQSDWSFQSNTVDTQDRLNKTTHYTAVPGATASLTFTGAIAVYFVGYAMKGVSPPALIPITLLPSHGSPITVQSDAYRPTGASNQIILFNSNKLDPSEIYTITVTKTNATLGTDVNIDSFILTMPDGADSIPSPPAQTTVIDSIIPSPPFFSLVPCASTTTSDSSAQPSSVANTDSNNTTGDSSAPFSSVANTDSSNTSNTGRIAGGVIGGLAIAVIIAFLAFRWWSRRNQQRQWPPGPDGVPIPFYINNTPRSADLFAASPYSSKSAVPAVTAKLVGTTIPRQISVNRGTETAQAQRTMSPTPRMQGKTRQGKTWYTGNWQPSPFVSVNGGTEIAQAQRTMSSTPRIQEKTRYMGNWQPSPFVSVNGGTEMAQAQRTMSSTPRVQEKTRYMGNWQPSPFVSAPSSSSHRVPPSPEGTEDREAMLPAYS